MAQELADWLRGAGRILVFTGAGISTPSGIPAFRGKGGIWTTRQPVYYQDFMEHEESRVEYWEYKLELWEKHGNAQPNVIHESIVQLEQAEKVELVATQNVDGLHRTAQYDVLILGISTWDFGEIQEDWESQWQDIRELPLDGKIVAIFGLGDQMGYADWFQDALGMLHDEVLARQANIIGYWPNEGYDFTASKALTEDQSRFVGLSLDDENQYDLTDTRIAQWCQQLIDEMSDE